MADPNKQNAKSHTTWCWILLCLVLISGLFFRFHNLEKKVYWFDEAITSLRISGYSWQEVIHILDAREIGIHELKKFQQVNSEKGLKNTISSLATDDPKHSPLYFGLARIWAGLFGDSIWVIRSLSVLASLLVFPCLFWLCRELFETPHVAWVAVTLAAVSPFHLLYAQEARPYSLWMVTILLSSIFLLRAINKQTYRNWFVYAASVSVGIYTHTLFGFIIIAHGVYVIGNFIRQIERKPLRWPGIWTAYAAATLTGLATFLPWAYVIIQKISSVISSLPGQGGTDLFRLVGMWGFNFSSVFIDAGFSLKLVEQYNMGIIVSYSFRVIILAILAYSIYFLYRNTKKQTWLFIFALIAVPFLLLALPDLFLGRARSGWGYRYLTASFLGIQITLAYMLGTHMSSIYPIYRRIGYAVVTLVIVCGIVSCSIISQAENWWNKSYCFQAPQIARIINQTPRPLLIAKASRMFLPFSHLLDLKVRIKVVEETEIIEVPDGFSDVFVLDPSPIMRKNLEQIERFSPVVVDSNCCLWQLGKL